MVSHRLSLFLYLPFAWDRKTSTAVLFQVFEVRYSNELISLCLFLELASWVALALAIVSQSISRALSPQLAFLFFLNNLSSICY